MKQIFIFLLITLISSFAIGQSKTSISGQIDNLDKDTIKCIILENGIIQQSNTIRVPVINNRFELKLEIVKPKVITITEGDTYISGIIEPNDNIYITYDANNSEQTLKYEGNSKEKFQLLNSLIQAKINNKIKSQFIIGAIYWSRRGAPCHLQPLQWWDRDSGRCSPTGSPSCQAPFRAPPVQRPDGIP